MRDVSAKLCPEQAPTDQDALYAFRTLIEYCVARRTDPLLYDQRPGHLPPDAQSADSYRRWHRAARRAGVPGVWTRGKLLVATPEAWATPLPRRRRPVLVGSASGDDPALDAALGLRAARGSR
ncbi:MAG TPA: hypothetical protein VK841_22540 [Polyangiaceae bacterium]|jgi:hypothetical protein|nr:hypothetical protein [Polyangiaceae bacterium]